MEKSAGCQWNKSTEMHSIFIQKQGVSHKAAGYIWWEMNKNAANLCDAGEKTVYLCGNRQKWCRSNRRFALLGIFSGIVQPDRCERGPKNAGGHRRGRCKFPRLGFPAEWERCGG